ncbi:MAG: hypothetical protein HQL90_12970 [Magnetococcales bacterium]|nr:hypothetical protein [Magnetococcales bacterium]
MNLAQLKKQAMDALLPTELCKGITPNMAGFDVGDVIDFDKRLGRGMILVTTGRMSPGFPRGGELLNKQGNKSVRRYDPLAVLAWVRTAEDMLNREADEASYQKAMNDERKRMEERKRQELEAEAAAEKHP